MSLLSTSNRVRLYSCLLSSALALATSACHDRPAEGPAQRAGEKADNAARDTKDAVKDSARDVKHDLQK
jgi:hypothetical protein